MEKLSYKTLENVGYDGYLLKDAKEKVLQFGEGNFLRAFVDYWFDLANEKADWNGKCCLVQPIAPGLAEMINEQDGLYTLHLRGSVNGEKVDDKRIISSVSRCLNPYQEEGFNEMMKVAASDDLEIIVSNTTEAGIHYDPSCQFEDKPAASFPGKLTQVLYHRYKNNKPGILMLACELIDNNGKELARLEEENHYADPLTDVGEVFGLWVIEGDEKLNDVLPFKKAGLIDKVFVTPDMSPYKKRKVRILNGAHTGFVLGAYLAGQNIFRDCMHDEVIKGFMNKMLYDEVIPTLTLDKNDLLNFAKAVSDRFNNPFVNHELMSISLNSTSKWKARNMPSFLGYIDEHHALPKCITTSFAFYIQFYRGYELTDAGLVAKRPAGNTYTISDDRDILEFYYNHKDDSVKDLVHAVCTNTSFWGQDLTQIAGFEDAVVQTLTEIEEKGTYEVMKECL